MPGSPAINYFSSRTVPAALHRPQWTRLAQPPAAVQAATRPHGPARPPPQAAAANRKRDVGYTEMRRRAHKQVGGWGSPWLACALRCAVLWCGTCQ